jgi:uncharacterized protein
MDEVTVIKLNPRREETWRYTGQVLARKDQFARIEARFNRDDLPFQEVLLKRGDRFLEDYYSDRWFNIFEIYDRDDGQVKCWYCNVTLPAEFDGDVIRYVDLALDLIVYPDGRQAVLDEDEFAALDISEEMRQGALAALEDLKRLVRPGDGFRLGSRND